MSIGRPGRLGRRAICGALALLATVAPAARATWSGPMTVATNANALFAPGLTWTGTGRGVLSWVTGAEDDVALATAPPATDRFTARGVYRPARRVYAGDNGNLATYAKSGLALSGVTASNRIAVVLGRVGSAAGRRVTVGPTLQSGPGEVVANAAGDLAVVSLTQTRARDLRTLAPTLVVRRHGRFGRPIRVAGASRHYIGELEVAINPRGDVLVAWQRGRTIYARLRTAAGHMRPAARLGENGRAQISVWLASDRSAAVAWEAPDLSTTQVRAVRAVPGGRFLRRAALLEQFDGHIRPETCGGPTRGVKLVRVTGIRSGQPVVAWTARESRHLVVRAAVGRGSKRFRFTPLTYSPTRNSCVDAIAVDRGGRATILWSQSTARDGVVDLLAASQASPGGAYPSPESVAAGAIPGASLAVDPLSKRLAAAWVTLDQRVQVATGVF
jgi:hypothetical protein